jgi:hypothetical protein
MEFKRTSDVLTDYLERKDNLNDIQTIRKLYEHPQKGQKNRMDIGPA